jgi:hypothetical protein
MGIIGLAVVEVTDFGLREGLAERCHSLLPLLFADDGQTFDSSKVVKRKLGVFPQGTATPKALCSSLPCPPVWTAHDSSRYRPVNAFPTA